MLPPTTIPPRPRRSCTFELRLASRHFMVGPPSGGSAGQPQCQSDAQLVEVLLPQLRDLRRDDDAAVRLVRVPAVIIAVIRLCRPEFRGGHDFGHDAVPDTRALELGDRLLGDALLVGRRVEDRRPVLCADVGALTVEGRRVVDREEDVEQIAIGDYGGIELYADDRPVAGAAAANLVVRRLLDVPARVAGFDGVNAAQVVEHGLQAPEAAAGENGGLTRITHFALRGTGPCNMAAWREPRKGRAAGALPA